MAFTRTSIVRGPAIITYGSESFFSNDDIRISAGNEIFPIVNSAFGKVQERISQRTFTVEFTPVGVPSSSFWNFGTMKAGDSFLGSSDVDLVVHSLAGVKVTCYNVALTRLPDLILSTVKTCCGPMQFTVLGKGRPTLVDQDDPESYIKVETGINPTISFDPDEIITERYFSAWGSKSAPWDDIRTSDGWQVSIDLNLQPVVIDSHGLIDYTVGDVRATARCIPIGITDINLISQSGTPIIPLHLQRGAPLESDEDLGITGDSGTIIVQIKNAEVRVAPLQYGLTTNRLGTVEWTGLRRVVSSAVGDVFSVTVS